MSCTRGIWLSVIIFTYVVRLPSQACSTIKLYHYKNVSSTTECLLSLIKVTRSLAETHVVPYSSKQRSINAQKCYCTVIYCKSIVCVLWKELCVWHNCTIEQKRLLSHN